MTKQESKPLILLGGGGHARSTLDVIAAIDGLSVTGILDDSLEPGHTLLGVQILGPTEMMSEFVDTHYFVVALGKIGRSVKRRELAERCWAAGGSLRTVISPHAYVSPHAVVEQGAAIFHGAVVNAGARIGRNCIINSMALIEHDSVVGDHTHVSTGALVNGTCHIGNNVFLGSGSVLHHKAIVHDDAVVSAGQIITETATANEH